MNGHDEQAIAWMQRTASEDPDYQEWLANSQWQREYQEYLDDLRNRESGGTKAR